MSYNPNQARNAKGSPMAGAWAADNQRGAAGVPPGQSLTTDAIQDFIDSHSLNYGNASTEDEYVTVEGPGHSTVSIDLSELPHSATVEDFGTLAAERMREFNADDEFAMMWSADFASRNGFSASSFLEMLHRDEAYFTETATEIQGDLWRGEPGRAADSELTEDFVDDFIDAYRSEKSSAQRTPGKITFEAPGASRIIVDTEQFGADATSGDLITETASQMRAFDADEQFSKTWSDDFQRSSGLTPTEHLQNLQQDQNHFRNYAKLMRKYWGR